MCKRFVKMQYYTSKPYEPPNSLIMWSLPISIRYMMHTGEGRGCKTSPLSKSKNMSLSIPRPTVTTVGLLPLHGGVISTDGPSCPFSYTTPFFYLYTTINRTWCSCSVLADHPSVP